MSIFPLWALSNSLQSGWTHWLGGRDLRLPEHSEEVHSGLRKGLSQVIPLISYEYHRRLDGVTKALECLDHLSRLGELLVNITPAERAVFASPQWHTASSFVPFFREEVPLMAGYDFGDIFVKVQPLNVARTA
jgi:hypothetical protein